MELRQLIQSYKLKLLKKGGLTKYQLKALGAIENCRTPTYGSMEVQCPCCGKSKHIFHSCGNRFCPTCQNHETTIWLERQRRKLLPGQYFMVTFTLPSQLREMVRSGSKEVFEHIFSAAKDTLDTIALNKKYLGGKIGFTGVLHTHSRRLDFHPHIHFIVPALAYDKKNRTLISKGSEYLFPEKVLGRVFRGKLTSRLKTVGLYFTSQVYHINWIVNCQYVGKGEKALEYLSKYLYRGVIREKNIIRDQNGQVTFSYTNSRSGQTEERTLPGESFLRLILQHVLPKGFRRSRDYGFLHGNARKRLRKIQYILGVKLKVVVPKRPRVICPDCKKQMVIVEIYIKGFNRHLNCREPPVPKTITG